MSELKTAYVVYDGDKRAQWPDHEVDKSWSCATYLNFDDALIYARKWLGAYGGSWDGKTGIELKLNEPYYYGAGVTIEIRSIELTKVKI